jgi:alpha-tubulin suppressor-like RCC1 family protein
MKTMVGLRRYKCVARTGIFFLVAVALITLVASCAYDVVMERSHYSLTIASSAGGSVITPGEGEFDYDARTVVNLMAEADAGYRFVIWTGNVATIADINAATTTITMNNDYSITARFEAIPPGQHNLAIASTAGGRVITPGEGNFLYDEGTLVNLVAAPDEGYWFVNWTDHAGAIANVNAAVTTITMHGDYTITANFEEQVAVEPMVAAGGWHTVGLRSDGTLIAVGDNSAGQRDVANWTAIIRIAAGDYHTVGLKSGGTVVAVGPPPGSEYDFGQCGVSDWSDIVQIAAGDYHTVGLRSDGTVVAVGPPPGSEYDVGQCNVEGWRDIVGIGVGNYHTVGIRSDGTVVAVGYNDDRQCDVDGWTDIVQVAAGFAHTVGLRSDGTVVAVGPPPGSEYDAGQCDVVDWTDIVQVAAGQLCTVGLRSDGTVVAVGPSPGSEYDAGQCDVVDWTDIVQVAAGGYHTVGLKSDGRVVAVGASNYGQCAVHGWNLAG